MKKIIRKVKGKKVLSFVLAAIMLATTFNMALPMLKLDVSAASPIDSITQERIVSDYEAKYDNYAAQFLNGASNPTNMVIPGLNAAQDYVIQGMTYYPKRDWMLITAYHNAADGETVQSSKVFALDAATGEFVAMFSFLNPDGTVNTEHGGGIAVSENNIYYACGDDDRQIAYAPISEFEKAALNEHIVVKLVDMVEFEEVGSVTSESKTAYTAYVCYDDGVLWTGNFYDPGVLIFGMPVAATDYSIPANNDYNSMVFGYRLSGSDSATEWANLMGALGKDCRGNPSYVIGLNNAIKDVQYAVVDNGKLYLSCSFGTGEGTTSVNVGKMNPYSTLVVADIDLTQPGTKKTTIAGNKTVYAYDIQNYKKFDMMPMSEGLCVVNDNIFITFESASNKYLKEAGALTGNCNHPVDVVWQLDPYKLMETTVAEPERSIYYEKVYSVDDIISGEEYIIVHESKEKSKVTQNNYLYALNAKGNFNGLELSKSEVNSIKGYDGMIGHPIDYYSFEKINKNGRDVEILYLGRPEEDDIENIRWTISKTDGGKFSIKNTSTYFANYNNFYFDQSKITMAPNNVKYLDYIKISQADGAEGSGYFCLSNKPSATEEYFLWCNDGLVANYNTKANEYYTKNKETYPILDGVTETAGTFHCDAMNLSGENILGGSVDLSDDDPNIPCEDGAFQIYHRIVDENASTYESRVYTDLDAELQADGTYTVTLETYAISPNHYQYVGEKATDYIIVADTSSSMGSTGGTGFMEYNGALSMGSMCTEEASHKDRGHGVAGYALTNENIYFKHSDNKLYRGYIAVRIDEEYEYKNDLGCQATKWMQFYYVYYIADDGLYYCFDNQIGTGNAPTARGYDDWMSWVNGAQGIQSASSDQNDIINGNSTRRKEQVYNGLHYRYDNAVSSPSSEVVCINTVKTTATNIVNSIAAENSENRIAIVNNTGSEIKQTGFVDKTTAIKTISDFTAGGSDGSPGNGGMDAVNSIISANKTWYDKKDNSGKNVVVIFITDGIPDGSNPTDAANGIINAAKAAKTAGAFIYTVNLGKNEVTDFPKKKYLDAVSSKYAAAASLTDLGGQSIDGVHYALSVSDATKEYYTIFGESTLEEVEKNNAIVLDNLNDTAILREQISDAFKIPDDFTKDNNIRVELINGAYDEVGRFSFREDTATSQKNLADAANIKTNTDVDSTTKTLEVTSYNYGQEYIAKNKAQPGRKLRVTIIGLLADETKDIRNTSISNTDTTALYKNEDNMADGIVFKKISTEYFNIPKYTYVLDYGLDMLDINVNGTLKSVSDDLTAQRDANGNLAYKSESENGLVKITNQSQHLLYHTSPTNMNDSGYVLIQRPTEEGEKAKYDWFEIEVVPASNVYFEETEFAKNAGTGTVAWDGATGGTSASHRELPKELDVDGYDEAYNNTNTYSNGKTLLATVNAANKRSKTATVNFTGDGIDIISACGPTTGLQIINIKDAKTGKSVKAGIVDTYYSGDNFTQVPVFSWRGAHGTYTVESTAVYLSTAGALNATSTTKGIKNNLIDTGLEMNTSTSFDENVLQAMLDEAGVEGIDAENVELIWHDDNSILNGGTGVAPTKKGTRGATATDITLYNYLDGFRIYNPLGADSDSYTESEKKASYVNVINNLAPVENGKDTLDGIGFITGVLGENETNLNFSNYQSVGPKDEFYLVGSSTETKAVTFKTKVNIGEKVMLGLRAVDGPTTVKITSNKNSENVQITVNSATEMFYDISKCIGDITADGTEVQVIVQNTDAEGNMLAVNQVKFSGGTKVNNGNTPVARSLARTGDATILVSEDVFLPLTAEALTEVEISLTEKETVQGEIKNGVIIPVEEEIPEDNTNTDNDNTNDGTDTEESENEEFSLFSLIEMLIAFIEKILYNAFGAGSIA